MDWSGCPIVEVIPGKVSGAPILVGTRLPADVIVSNFLAGSPLEEIADNFEVSVEKVEAILRYALTLSAKLAA